MTLRTGDTLSVNAVGVAGESPDVAILVLDTCPPVADSCVAGVDVGFTLQPDQLEFTNTGPDATFFLVLDSFFGGGFTYELTWDIDRA